MRHNAAGTAIVEAIYNGSKGNQLIASDVGVNKRRQAQGLPKLATGRTIPTAALPREVPAKIKQQLTSGSVPDAVLYHFDRKRRQRNYTLVEIKYCRDTNPEEQIMRAEAQHADLAGTLKMYDPTANIRQCNLMLGVSGAMYTSTAQHLQSDLGVDGSELSNLLKKLHLIAIEHLEKIWRHRRAKIKERAGKKLLKPHVRNPRNPRNRRMKPARPKR